MGIIRTNEVINLTGLSRTTIWRLQQDGDFPIRIRLGKNSVGWRSKDIQDWIDSRPSVSMTGECDEV